MVLFMIIRVYTRGKKKHKVAKKIKYLNNSLYFLYFGNTTILRNPVEHLLRPSSQLAQARRLRTRSCWFLAHRKKGCNKI